MRPAASAGREAALSPCCAIWWSEAQNGGLRVIVKVDGETAGRLGVSMQAINDALNDAFGQRQISTIYAQANQYRVVLEAMPQYQSDPPLEPAAGAHVRPGRRRTRRLAARHARPLAMDRARTAPLTVSTRTSFPRSPSASTWRRAPPSSDAVDGHHAGGARDRHADSVVGSYSGDADEFTQVAARASPG